MADYLDDAICCCNHGFSEHHELGYCLCCGCEFFEADITDNDPLTADEVEQ